MRLVGAHEVEDEVGATTAGQLAHGVDRARAVEHLARAELGGEAAAPGVGVDCDRGARAELVQELQRDVADSADADHGGRRARQGAMCQPPDRVVRRESRVGCGATSAGSTPAGRRRSERSTRDVVGEAAVDREARELMARAVHVDAAPAGHAEAAAVGRVHEHGVALGDRRHAVAGLLDPARVLVAEDPRQPDAGGLHQALDGVQIGRAHTRAADPHDDVARVRDLGHRPLDELERLVVGAHECRFHGVLLGLEVAGGSNERTSSCR